MSRVLVVTKVKIWGKMGSSQSKRLKIKVAKAERGQTYSTKATINAMC